ncbi:DUF4275 family protein [Oceanirhabdus seepicola]|uniref:DUF4275 family protein n=1 Tax=Oceanirhabdus seepicola TaxID=2828781 RepID=UPI0030B8F31B
MKVFTKDVDTKNIYLDCFLWHVFSYERLECLKGVEANKAFNDLKKNNIYIFFNEGEVVYKLSNSEKFTTDDLDYFEGVWPYEDAYVVDEDFSWTYVRTHESECGPYFVAM